MPILTQEQTDIVAGRITGNKNTKYSAINKLKAFQQQHMDHDYVAQIDSLIPQAESVAREAMKRNRAGRVKVLADWDKVFHGEMARLAREAGLRR